MPGPDVFDQLLAAKWRDIEFPVTRMSVSIAHDLVEHKYLGVDGSRVESTGLAPLRFTFSAPLLNGISPGKNEKWGQTDRLYPATMRKLMFSVQKKEQGRLQHPEFGNITCKAERFDMDWDAGRRGGVDAELSFVETLDENGVSSLDEDVQSIKGDKKGAPIVPATTLENHKADARELLKRQLRAKGLPFPPGIDKPTTDLRDLANAVNKVVSYPQLVSYRSGGQIAAMRYQAQRMKDQADLTRSALTWPTTQAAEELLAVTHELEQKLLQGSRTVAFYTVPAATTLAGVCRQLPQAKITDLIKLNPGLMRGPEIDRGTVVRHYVAA